jgi:hypothetical protein
MVKFDPICGDGASVGWNYISGPRFGKKMVYRWWADKEFGTIFFHDHLFANYRQKHGLFGALIVEPVGAKFYDINTNREIVSGLQAAIVLRKPVEDRLRFREFCIGIGDFIPMWNRAGEALNPSEIPGGHGDQGVMALNYRNAPIRERAGDPAFWFSSHPEHGHGDPSTTIFRTYENDPVWFRLIQGSHEESHSFQIHGMRWRRFRANLDSSIRNQQTFGIAEAFTFINHETYGPGDYMYKLSGADDLWLGCWGIIRAFRANASPGETDGLIRLTDIGRAVSEVEASERDARNVLEEEFAPQVTTTPPRRRFYVVAEARKLVYRDRAPALIDPRGQVFRLTHEWRPEEQRWRAVPLQKPIQPLVLRCREGEEVEVLLENRLLTIARPEPHAPEVPLEIHSRPVSEHVSMHADLVRYDVRHSDGATVGFNPRQSVRQGYVRSYFWRTDRPANSNAGEPLGPVLLQDMADFRYHRHHGLVGALVIEAATATPLAVRENEATARPGAPQAWHGSRATILKGEEQSEEIVLLLQDGLRLYRNGNTNDPVKDFPDTEPPGEREHEDQGQKAFNYRSEIVGTFDPGGPDDILGIPNPATPVWLVPVDKQVRFHLVGSTDKPRNYSFTIHGVTWPEWRFLSGSNRPMVASESAITCGTARTFEFTPAHIGDHAYRSGMLKWSVHQGLWGIMRVVGRGRRLGELTGSEAESTRRISNTGTLALSGLAFAIGFLLGRRTRS